MWVEHLHTNLKLKN